jgi:hypothetical protein
LELVTTLGDHAKTDISVWEIERFLQLWKEIDATKIFNRTLDNGPNGVLVSESSDGRGSILLPRTGDFSEIQQIAHEIFIDPYLRAERASVSIINASGRVETGQQVIRLLKSYGYQVADNTSKNQPKVKKTTLVDHTGTKRYTKKFLESRFKAKAVSKNNTSLGYDITLTLGPDYQLPKSKPLPIPSVKSSPTISPSPESGLNNDQISN